MVLAGDVVEFAQDAHAFFYLVTLYLLGHQQAYAALVIVAQHRHEVVGLVVLTAKTQHQHGSCIGVQTDVSEYLTGVLVVIGEL